MKKEILFSDLAKQCAPYENISDKRLKDKWYSCSYETKDFSGSMLVAFEECNPNDVELNPKISGWHKIYVGLYTHFTEQSEIDIKLTSDEAFMAVSPCLERGFGEHIVEDVFWKCAKMDGESIVMGKHNSIGRTQNAMIAWIRFVPMSEEETEKHLFEQNRTDTKRLYATDDMHNKLCFRDVSHISGWKTAVANVCNSDVEWLAVENLSLNDGEAGDGDIEAFCFRSAYERSYAQRAKTDFSYDTLKEVVDYGKRMKLKMCVSQRVAMWQMEFPESGIFFDKKFTLENPALRCIDRDGDVTEYLSFMYPEVQNYIIDEFVRLAKTGCDALMPIFSRGWPFILFEKPFCDKFFERYGEDARELPLDDERIMKLKCEIMTDFMKKLKSAIKNAVPERKPELHAKVLFSLYDCRLVGLDVETWAKEGVCERIISAERRIREVLIPEIMREENPGKIDLKKFSEYASSGEHCHIEYHYDNIFAPMADSKGIMRGPESQAERVGEFAAIEQKYGLKTYIEIMPRTLAPDKIKEKALAIYNAGGNNIALWDAETRTKRLAEWSMWRRLGHKDELSGFEAYDSSLMNKVRIIKLEGKNVRTYKPLWGG